MESNNVIPLITGYELRIMNEADFWPHLQKHSDAIFEEDSLMYRLADILPQEQTKRFSEMKAEFPCPFQLCIGLFKDEQFVGWHYGRQDSVISFYMQNSAILPEHRGQGLYSLMLKFVIKRAIAHGFQTIHSRHNVTNNAVIIPKLKSGFLITGLEISDFFGTLVNLSYYPNKTRQKIMDFRVGQIRPDDEIRALFKL